jgi:hypothetical protein
VDYHLPDPNGFDLFHDPGEAVCELLTNWTTTLMTTLTPLARFRDGTEPTWGTLVDWRQRSAPPGGGSVRYPKPDTRR